MITHDNLQRIEVDYKADKTLHLYASLIDNDKINQQSIPMHLESGGGR